MAGQNDPRTGWVVLGVLLLFIGLLFTLPMLRESRPEHAQLAVLEVSSRVVPGAEGPRLFIVGRVANTAVADGTRVWFRVNVYNDGNRLVDTFLAESPGLIVPAHGDAMFRVVAPTSAPESGRVEVTVDRAGRRR